MKKNWFRRFGISLIILVLLIGALAWTFLAVQPLPSAKPAVEQALYYSPQYEITATKSLSVWPQGTSLEQGRPAYFYAALPLVKLTPTFNASNLAQGQFNGTLESKTYLQATDDNKNIYWTYPMQTVAAENFTLTKNVQGQADSVTFLGHPIVLDVSTANAKVLDISKELGLNSASFSLVVETTIKIEGTSAGVPISKTVQNILPITLKETSFTAPKSEDSLSRILINTSDSSNLSLQQQYMALAIKIWPLLAADLALLLALIILLSQNKVRVAKDAVEHRRFKEWITEGSFQAKGATPINITSLEGLVDLAIDLDKRIIHDPAQKKYFVLDEKVVYIFDPFKQSLMTGGKPQLGKLLIDSGVLSPNQLEIALYYQQRIGTQLGESLIALGFIDEITLYSTLAAQRKFSFLELKPEEFQIDTQNLKKMTLSQAQVLLALPLGKRDDGKLVVACSDPGKEVIMTALTETFQTDIALVMVRPSVLRAVISSLAAAEKQTQESNIGLDSKNRDKQINPLASLERKDFINGYHRGTIPLKIFLRATGLASHTAISTVPEQDQILGWLASKGTLDGNLANLIRGLSRAINAIDWKERQEKKIPDLLSVLQNADYLSADDAAWAVKESSLQNKSIDRLLVESFLASAESIENAKWLINCLEQILTQNSGTNS